MAINANICQTIISLVICKFGNFVFTGQLIAKIGQYFINKPIKDGGSTAGLPPCNKPKDQQSN